MSSNNNFESKNKRTIVDSIDEQIKKRDKKLKNKKTQETPSIIKTNTNGKKLKFGSNNPFYRHLKILCSRKDKEKKGLFHKSKKLIFNALLENYEKILTENRIVFGDIMKDDDVRWLLDSLIPFNKGAFIEDQTRLTEEYEKPLIDTIKKMYDTQNEINSSNVIGNTRDILKNVEPTDEIDSYYPKRGFSFSDFMLNAMHNKDLDYVFSGLVPESETEYPEETVSTIGINLNSFIGIREIITKKKAICTAKNSNGVECGNVVYFNDIHESSVIKCVDSLPEENRISDFTGHSIKNISTKSIVKEKMSLYMYQGKTEKNENDILIFSRFKIDAKYIKANIIGSTFGDGPNMNIVIAIEDMNSNEKNMLPEGEKIFDFDAEKHEDWLEALYDGSKKYFKKYLKIKITDRGKIVGMLFIMQVVFNEKLDLATKSIILGTSGIGKSYFNKVFVPMFTSSHTTVYGREVTRTKLMGGQPSKEDMKVMGSFVPGLVATHNFICFEEAADILNDMHKNRIFNRDESNKNIFTLMKGCDNKYDTYNIAIQGGKEATFIATITVLGNIENLSSIRSDYSRKVKQVYGRASPPFKESWILSKPIEYYSEVMGNEKLAKAHQQVRNDMLPMDYMTYLPEAEIGRYDFKIYLENSDDGYPKEILMRLTSKDIDNIHRPQIQKELSEKFGDKPPSQKVWLESKLGDSVNKLLLKHIRGKNNFIFTNKNYNKQLLSNTHRWSTAFAMYNRMAFSKKKLTIRQACAEAINEKESKLLTDKYWLYDYNSLNDEEASMKKKPFYQSFIFDRDDVFNETEDEKKNEGIKVEKEDEGIDPFKKFEDD